MKLSQMKRAAGNAAALLKSLSNPERLLILCCLAEGEISVGEIETHLKMRQPRLSQQLARLRKDGLVTTRRNSRSIIYALGSASAESVITLLYDLYCAKPAQPKRSSSRRGARN